jgi:AmmeMemoRadiSam system protein B/AmmeMemoRadiSam system protein A
MFGFVSGCSSQERDPSPRKEDRKPAAAGRFYPSDPGELRAMLEGYLKEAGKPVANNVMAVISPHAGYVFSGPVAAHAFNQVDAGKAYENVFVIASSHQVSFMGASIYNKGDYVTPLGKVPVNFELADELIRNHPVFSFHPEADKYEHSLEVQVPFLQVRLQQPFRLVPIVLGTQSPESCKKIAIALKPYFNEKNLFVISTDFSHYPGYDEAVIADKSTCDAIISNDPDVFLSFLKQYKARDVDHLATNCCGWTSVVTLLYMTADRDDIRYTPVFYQNSGDSKYGDKHQVVGYWAIAISKENGKAENESGIQFSDKEKEILLGIARNTVTKYVSEGKIPDIDPSGFTPNLSLKAGAFVTLKKEGNLRGCIGRFTSDIPLYRLIQQMAVASATEDYRFSPVKPDEVDDLEIEISVLSPMKKIYDINEIELGKHGIYIRKGGSSGTFLPQVATETGWSVEEFLGHCARDKAGIGWDGWKNAELYTYEALVFSEADLSGHKH